MITIRRADERGKGEHGWLISRHSFSFADYYDQNHMNFSVLRVINEDRVLNGRGFGEHGHKNMEIISYVKEGVLTHSDSLGNTAVIKPGEIQIMSAGTGVIHSEKNDSPNVFAHFYQIWILPDKENLKPSYGQKSFREEMKTSPLVLVLSKDQREGSLKINQDADIYLCSLKENASLSFSIKEKRKVWLQMIRGEVLLNGEKIEAGDGVSFAEEKELTLTAAKDSEAFLFDLPS